ncbi:hypothetical protein BU202_02910 [Streptococcus cuniculi]|uniref:DUF4097 domain-containing protein n=1 Tax=Streptococcus cuniculi TaxID=1432788 RepID=A0A1Q8E9W3_9STRE|nr:DUF4097 family beta strand repeat-containing protein [Streptococcus cuniculi]OLF48584.1 hypothetical protein BU202_02910 [Streptococcus cuniculi]
MTRNEYLSQLLAALHTLNQQEQEDVLDYFNEYFDECPDVDEAIRHLGTPQEAAEEILANLDMEVVQHVTETEPITSSQISIWNRLFEKTQQTLQDSQREAKKALSPVTLTLEDIDTIQLELEDFHLTITESETEQIELRYFQHQLNAEKPFHYSIHGRTLSLQSRDGGIRVPSHFFLQFAFTPQVTLALPRHIQLNKVTGRLEDANLELKLPTIQTLVLEVEDSSLSIEGLTIVTTSLELEDANITIKDSHLQKLSLEMSDSNMSLSHSTIEQAHLELEDANFSASAVRFLQDVRISACDSNLSLTLEKQAGTSYHFSSEDGSMSISPEFQGQIRVDDDYSQFDYQAPNEEHRLTIENEDGMLTIK